MTTETLTLAAFLLARLAEDEAAAAAAAGEVGDPDWCAGGADYEGIVVLSGAVEVANGQTTPTTTHIARHDPARVLAEVAAKRAIVGLHEMVDHGLTYPGAPAACDRCQTVDGSTPTRIRGVWPCPTLRALASVYADHEDYHAEWAS